MKYFSTFSGIGGFELAIKQAYEHHIFSWSGKAPKGSSSSTIFQPSLAGGQTNQQYQRKRSNAHGSRKSLLDSRRPTCVGYSEINPYAISIYQKHFPNHINYGDITTINPETLPDFDLLVGGFPCQSFSMAGKRQGFRDPRGTLFFEIVRIIREKQPRLLLLENVKGLLSHDQGDTFATILITLSELGYDCQWQVINSKYYVPQNRERIFIVGHLRGTHRPKVFPLWPQKRICSRPQQNEKRVYTGTLTARQFASWNGNFIKENYHQIRRLTPLECERLQGFPDHWTAKGIRNEDEVDISDTQRYKVLGNAVTVNVVEAIMRKILSCLNESDNQPT